MKETVYRITKLKFSISKNTSIEMPADMPHYESNYLQVLVRNFWGKSSWRFIPCDAEHSGKKIKRLTQLPQRIDDKPFFQFINHPEEERLRSQFMDIYPDVQDYLQIKTKSQSQQLEIRSNAVISWKMEASKPEPRVMNRFKWAAIWFVFILLSVVTSSVL